MTTAVGEALRSVAGDRELLVDLLTTLAEVATPAGRESATARRLAEWIPARLPELAVSVDEFAPDRANLVAAAGHGDAPIGLYAHLDTSLTGDGIRDAPITGRADPVAAVRRDGDDLVGLGLAVAKASSAGALIAARAIARALPGAPVEVLLAAGGTHRLGDGATGFGTGARRALAHGFHPGALINVKAAAPGPLGEEPGAAYLGVRIDGTWEPALFREASPGIVGMLGPLVATVEAWRTELVARPVPPGSACGREAALGAVAVGDLGKPDLLPAMIRGRVFVVLAPGDHPEALAAELATRLGDALDEHLRVAVTVDAFDLAAATSSDERVVRVAEQVWTDRFGPPPTVSGWRGSTDGVVFRAAGIPTVRVGPQVVRDADDPRCDRVDIDDLLACVGMWAEIGVRWLLERVEQVEVG